MKRMKIKYLVLLPLLIAVFACSSKVKESNLNENKDLEIYPFIDGTEIVFVEKSNGAALLAQSDVYTKGLSLFDIQAKTQNIASTKEADYLDFSSKQAEAWTEEEITKMKLVITSVASKIKALNLNLNLPKQIKLVKTSLEEEGGAGGYTRSNYIVLKSSVGDNTFAHELFHIYSRANSDKRDEIYKTINFQKCNSIKIPAALKAMRLTNPDAPVLEHFLNLEVNGKQQEVVFITYADRAYNGGSFFEYLKRDLMFIEGEKDNKTVVLSNGNAILKDYSESSNIYDLIGRNTDYNIHPEEILADHFSALVRGQSVKEPKYLEAMKLVLQKK